MVTSSPTSCWVSWTRASATTDNCAHARFVWELSMSETHDPLTEPSDTMVATAVDEREQHESYFQLVWRRFRKSKPAIIGGLLVITLVLLAVFFDFFLLLSDCVVLPLAAISS